MTKSSAKKQTSKKASSKQSTIRKILFGLLVVVCILFAVLFSPLNHLLNIRLKDVFSLPVPDSSAYFTDPVLPGGTASAAPYADALASFSFTLDDTAFALPCRFTDLTAAGWQCTVDAAQTLDPETSVTVDFEKGGSHCYAYMVNRDINTVPYTECFLSSIIFYTMDGVTAGFPGGLQTDVSNQTDVHAAYGKPTSGASDSDTYDASDTSTISFQYSPEIGTICGFSVSNSAIPAGFRRSEPSTDLPECVSAYQTPTELSSDPADFTVSYGGDLYTLPAPASAFLANGWDSSPTYEDKSVLHYLPAHSTGFLTMKKDGLTQELYVTNPTDLAYVDENTMVYLLFSGGIYDDAVPITVLGNVTLGTSLADLRLAAASAGVECTTADDLTQNVTVFYNINIGTNQQYSFEVETKTQTIIGIAVKNARFDTDSAAQTTAESAA